MKTPRVVYIPLHMSTNIAPPEHQSGPDGISGFIGSLHGAIGTLDNLHLRKEMISRANALIGKSTGFSDAHVLALAQYLPEVIPLVVSRGGNIHAQAHVGGSTICVLSKTMGEATLLADLYGAQKASVLFAEIIDHGMFPHPALHDNGKVFHPVCELIYQIEQNPWLCEIAYKALPKMDEEETTACLGMLACMRNMPIGLAERAIECGARVDIACMQRGDQLETLFDTLTHHPVPGTAAHFKAFFAQCQAQKLDGGTPASQGRTRPRF